MWGHVPLTIQNQGKSKKWSADAKLYLLLKEHLVTDPQHVLHPPLTSFQSFLGFELVLGQAAFNVFKTITASACRVSSRKRPDTIKDSSTKFGFATPPRKSSTLKKTVEIPQADSFLGGNPEQTELYPVVLEAGNVLGAFLQTPAAILDKTPGSMGA